MTTETKENVEFKDDDSALYEGKVVKAEHVFVNGVAKAIRLHYDNGHMVEIGTDTPSARLTYASAR